MSVQEDHSTHVCGHHGYHLTHSRDPDGYASEATHLPTQYCKFNNWIRIEVGKLASRGQEANDLLTYLWKSYQVVADKKFVAYIEQLKDEHDKGRVTYMAT